MWCWKMDRFKQKIHSILWTFKHWWTIEVVILEYSKLARKWWIYGYFWFVCFFLLLRWWRLWNKLRRWRIWFKRYRKWIRWSKTRFCKLFLRSSIKSKILQSIYQWFPKSKLYSIVRKMWFQRRSYWNLWRC